MPIRLTFSFIFFLLLAFPAMSKTHEMFYGSWGTQAQCDKKPIKPGGTVLSTPFEIDKRWFKQGQQWCLLNWGVIEKRENGYFTAANALCGEDAPQSYFLGFELKNNELTLRWDFPRKNGPLMRCEAE
jgi:hypothetical protein